MMQLVYKMHPSWSRPLSPKEREALVASNIKDAVWENRSRFIEPCSVDDEFDLIDDDDSF